MKDFLKKTLQSRTMPLVLTTLLAITACSDDDNFAPTPSAVDEKEMPASTTIWVDENYSPGDNFFMYRNGKYWVTPMGVKDNGEEYRTQGIYEDEAESYMKDNYKFDYDYTEAIEGQKSRYADGSSAQSLALAEEYVAKHIGMIRNATDMAELAQAQAEIIKDGGSPILVPAIFQFVQEDGQAKVNAILIPNLLAVKVAAINGGEKLLQRAGIGVEESVAMAEMTKETASLLDKDLDNLKVDVMGAVKMSNKPVTTATTRAGDKARFDMLIAEKLGLSSVYQSSVTDETAEELLGLENYLEDVDLETLKAFCCFAVAGDIIRTSASEIESTLAGNESVMKTVKDEYSNLSDLVALPAYVKSYYVCQSLNNEATKRRVTDMLENFRTVTANRINSLDWMTSTTKAKALEKLAAMKFIVGGPSRWPDVELTPLGTDFYENLRTLRKGNLLLTSEVCRLDKYDGYVMLMAISWFDPLPLSEFNSTYSLVLNALNIYPTMLSGYFTDSRYSDAYVYGTLGTVLGHEMMHGFDNMGANYDKDGVMRNWWTDADRKEFDRRVAMLNDTYAQLEVYPEQDPTLRVNAEKTAAENIADLGGFLVALDAYTAKLISEGYYGTELTAQKKKFMYAYAESWRLKYKLKEAQRRVKNDVHATPRERVNGVVRNVDEWYELFDVKSTDKLYLAPEKRAYLW